MKIGLVTCSAKKIVKHDDGKKYKAKDLYKSSMFKLYLELAERETDKVYIISAWYGLLELDAEIVGYEYTLKRKTKKIKDQWGKKICDQLVERHITQIDKLIVYAGNDYFLPIKQYWGANIEKRLNIKGIGPLIKKLKELAAH